MYFFLMKSFGDNFLYRLLILSLYKPKHYRMRKIYFLLFLLLYVGAASVAQHKKLRVMSYNIRIASHPSKGWGVTKHDSISAVINRHPCDRIALHEEYRFIRL